MRRSLFAFLTLLVSVWSLTATASELTPIARSQTRWSAGDPAGGGAHSHVAARGWEADEAARKAAHGQDVLWASVAIPNGPWRSPTLLLQGASGMVELWINGVQVRQSTNSVEVFAAMRAVPVPLSALGNDVQLRMTTSSLRAGLTRVSIGEEAVVEKRLVRNGFLASVVGLLMLVVALAALAAWSLSRTDPFLLRVFAFALAAGSLAFGLGSASSVFGGEAVQVALLYLGVAVFPWAIVALVRDGFPKHGIAWGLWLERICMVWAAAFIGATVLGGMNVVVLFSPIVFLSAIGSSLFVALRAARAQEVDGQLLMGALAVFLAVTTYDSLPLFGARESTGFHTYVSLLAMTVAFVAIFARRTAASTKALVTQTQALREREKEGRAVTERLVTDAGELLDAVSQLRDSGVAQSRAIEQQASSLQETQVTAEEIRRTSTLAAEKAQSLLEQAAVADETQRAGELAVEESLAGISSIGAEVAAMAHAMDEVDQLAQEIGGIVEVVKGLADQSNMLALNAAIEAVRSGEHGKGFAVVAREVRRLADQSIQSTERIRGALERLEAGVRQSTAAGERGETSVATALERLRGSGEQMRSMSGILGETNASVRQISAAVTQQNAGISQIFTAVQMLSDQMKVAVDRMDEAESATLVVEGVAGRMSATRESA